MSLSLFEEMHPSWREKLAGAKSNFEKIETFLTGLRAEGEVILPQAPNIMRAFTKDPSDIKVVIVGQDPYPTPGHAVGLAFSVSPSTKLPRSLANIRKELESDAGETLKTGDLTKWEEQGVLLLNRVLTVTAGVAGSHQKKGWEEITEEAVKNLSQNLKPPVFILWGSPAQTLIPSLGDAPIVKSVHPSPLSARRGFFGSKPFSQVNSILKQRGQEPIRWGT